MYGVGALGYTYVLSAYTSDRMFYRVVYPLMALASTAAVFAVSGMAQLNETVLALSLAALFAVFEYARFYDDFLILGHIAASSVACYQLVYLMAKNVWQITGYLFLFLGVGNGVVVGLIAAMLAASLVVSLLHSRQFDPRRSLHPTSSIELNL